MMKFHALTVAKIEKTIREAVVLTLQPDDPAAFAFTQGQYLTFRRDFDGVELRRSYSICAGKDDGVLQVGIKRVDGGAFSSFANSELAVGDTLEAMPPMGAFHKPGELVTNAHYLAFAGGSGITPVLSILRTGLTQEPTARFTLVYANRNPNTIMFREELEDLKNLHMERLNIIHILEDDSQDIELFQGRVDAAKCTALLDSWIGSRNIKHEITKAYICGPEPMMLAISEALTAHGLSSDQIRMELFKSGQPGRAKTRAASQTLDAKGASGTVTWSGESRSFLIAPDQSLLEAAIANDVDPPYACKAGVCSTCRAKMIEGEVEMVANHSLEDYEVEAGYVLTCQSYPVSEKVVWDYDEAGH